MNLSDVNIDVQGSSRNVQSEKATPASSGNGSKDASPFEPSPSVAGSASLQTLLEQVRRLQLKEQAQFAKRSRQLRQEQDLLLVQQVASLKKQQKELQEFQKQLEEQQQIYKKNVLSGMSSDLIRSIIREEVKGETRNNAKSIRMNAPLSSATSSRSDGTISNLGLHGDNLDQTRLGTYGLAIGNSRTNLGNGDRSSAGVSGRTILDEPAGRLGFPAPDSNTNTASDLLGLGGIGSARESSARQSGDRNDLVGLLNVAGKRQSLRRSNKGLRVRGGTSPGSSRFKWNSPLSTSSFSSSSSSSSTSSTPSSPSSMYSSLSSSAASASSSSPLLSAASRIPSTSIASSASETQRAGGVARSWSIALQRGTPSTSRRQIFNPRSRSSSMLGSRSLLRDVALDKNRMIYNTREQLSFPRSNRNNPLGLRLDNPTSNDTPRQEGPTEDHTSYSTYPFTLSRPRYSSTAGRGTASRNHQQHQLRVRQQRLQHHQQPHAEQRRNVLGSQQHRQKQRLGNQRQGQARQPLPHQQLRGRHQLQRHSPNTQTSEFHDALTKQVLDNIEVRATPARRLTPGGPLRIGLDINVRHGVYPIESLKQP